MQFCHVIIASMDKKEKIRELVDRLNCWQRAYYIDSESIVSDMEYDRTFDELKELERENPDLILPDSPTQRVGSDLDNSFPEFTHTIPVLSLDKAYSEEEVLSFINKSSKKENARLSFVAEEKIDGISMVLYYSEGLLTRAVTRGNGIVGNDVTENVKTIKSVPLRLSQPLSLAVRGEVFISKKGFDAYNRSLPEGEEKAANARNLASGSVRRLKSSESARVDLDMFCYEGFWNVKSEGPEEHLLILRKLKDLGFKINSHISYFASTKEEAERKIREAGLEADAYSISDIKSYIDKKTRERSSLAYEIDGLVFKVNELDKRENLGYTEHHPRWAIAYKFESPQAVSRVREIAVQVGRTGRITPVAILDPVRLGGSEIRRASLHNQEYINALELSVGDTVSISKRGDVIPQVEEVLEKSEDSYLSFSLPSICPSCGTELEKTGAHLFCPNRDCPDRVKGEITFFSSRKQMDIETLGEKTVSLFYDKGILKKIEDIYTADYTKALSYEGFGEKAVFQIIRSVEKSKEQSFTTLLSSLGIPEIGKKTAEILVKAGFDSFEKLESAEEEDLVCISGIGEVSARTIVNAFSDQRLLNTISTLASCGLKVREEKEESTLDQIFEGTSWCITGSFENFNPREKALEEIKKRGGKTTSAVSKKTTYLLCGKGGGGKRADAEALGVKIMDENEFMSLISSSFPKKEKVVLNEQLELF